MSDFSEINGMHFCFHIVYRIIDSSVPVSIKILHDFLIFVPKKFFFCSFISVLIEVGFSVFGKIGWKILLVGFPVNFV